MKSIAEQAAEALAMLGDTPEEIYENLKGAGFKGKKWRPSLCPCGGLPYRTFWKNCLCVVPIDSQVEDFVLNMDNGKYPDLEEHEPA